jgi:hypothetical protein
MFWTVFYFVFNPTEKYVRNEIVLITGAAKGLGRQLAIEFAKRGSILGKKFNFIIKKGK